MTIHDVIIVGAGMAGLHCARRLLEEKPHLNVLMLEKYNYIVLTNDDIFDF